MLRHAGLLSGGLQLEGSTRHGVLRILARNWASVREEIQVGPRPPARAHRKRPAARGQPRAKRGKGKPTRKSNKGNTGTGTKSVQPDNSTGTEASPAPADLVPLDTTVSGECWERILGDQTLQCFMSLSRCLFTAKDTEDWADEFDGSIAWLLSERARGVAITCDAAWFTNGAPGTNYAYGI